MSKQEKTVESQQEQQEQPQQPIVYTKSDYIKARAVIASYKEAQKTRPKRQCSEKQLAALAAGRAKAAANRESKKAANANK